MRTIHLLNWKLKSIEKILEDIKSQGFDTIQINPMQPFKEAEYFSWWLVYQPLGFSIGNVFGTKEDLTNLCNKAKEKGINIIVDVISNHMANKSDIYPLEPYEEVDQVLVNNKDAWKEKIMLTNGEDKYDACHGLIGLPGLNQNNKEVQELTFKYLLELKNCGVSGFRFDAAKHIGLPSDGVSFFKNLKKLLKENNLYAYGEFLGGNTKWRDEMSKYLDVLSDTNNTLSNDNKHVTFIESHDNFLNRENSTYSIDSELVNILYYILCNKNSKTISYVRPLKGPYNPYNKSQKFSIIENSDELNYFDNSFLKDPIIKEANELIPQKKLQLIKKKL